MVRTGPQYARRGIERLRKDVEALNTGEDISGLTKEDLIKKLEKRDIGKQELSSPVPISPPSARKSTRPRKSVTQKSPARILDVDPATVNTKGKGTANVSEMSSPTNVGKTHRASAEPPTVRRGARGKGKARAATPIEEEEEEIDQLADDPTSSKSPLRESSFVHTEPMDGDLGGAKPNHGAVHHKSSPKATETTHLIAKLDQYAQRIADLETEVRHVQSNRQTVQDLLSKLQIYEAMQRRFSENPITKTLQDITSKYEALDSVVGALGRRMDEVDAQDLLNLIDTTVNALVKERTERIPELLSTIERVDKDHNIYLQRIQALEARPTGNAVPLGDTRPEKRAREDPTNEEESNRPAKIKYVNNLGPHTKQWIEKLADGSIRVVTKTGTQPSGRR